MRTNWIVISGMRRSGSALRYEIVKEIVGEEYAHGWIRWQDFSEVYNKVDGKEERAIVKSHTFLPSHCPVAAQVLRERRMWIVHSYRDIRDVAASMKTFMGEDWIKSEFENALVATMNESDSWMGVKSAYVSKYEHAVNNLEEEVFNIASYLGRSVDCKDIAKKFSISNNRERLPSSRRTKDGVWWHNHIGNGEVGKWERELSPSEINMVNRISHGWLKKMGYK
jgi:hypothetical protein